MISDKHTNYMLPAKTVNDKGLLFTGNRQSKRDLALKNNGTVYTYQIVYTFPDAETHRFTNVQCQKSARNLPNRTTAACGVRHDRTAEHQPPAVRAFECERSRAACKT